MNRRTETTTVTSLKALILLTLCIALATCSGCATSAALTPYVASGAPVIAQYSGRGKAESFWVARYDDVVQATLRAGEKLSLALKEQNIKEDKASLRYVEGQVALSSYRTPNRDGNTCPL
jgi:hypothetical protein